MQTPDKKVVIKRTFPASVERLWDAFTKIEDILKWHSPVGMTNPHAEIDFRVGGKYAIAMEYDESHEVVTVRGIYKEIEKPQKIVYSWKWDGSDEETEVIVQFREVSSDETEVTLTHLGFSKHPTESDIKHHRTHADHKNGWISGFRKLEDLVRK